MSHQSAEEALKIHKSKMGERIGESYHYCLNAVCDLSITWDQHETLFQNKQRVDVLNVTSGLLAHSIQRHFFNAVVLGLSRLTEQPSTGKKDNLTVSRLVMLCDEIKDLPLGDLTEELESRMSDLRKVRDKILAHNDYEVSTRKTKPPSMGTRQNITEIFRLIFRILGKVLLHFENSQLGMFPQGNESAWNLIYRLHFGAKFIEDIEKRAKAGNWMEMKKIDAPTWLELGEKETDRYKYDWEQMRV